MAMSSPIQVDGLTALSISVTGSWVRRDNYTWWEGFLEAESPFVALLVGYAPLCTYWSKSSGEARVDSRSSEGIRASLVVGVSRGPTAPLRSRLFLSAGNSAFIQQIMAILPTPEFLPEVDLPGEIEAGELVRFLEIPGCLGPILGVACFAKSDVKVRRKHVWGLKARLLAAAGPDLAEVLAHGRHGCIEGVWPPNVSLAQLDPRLLENSEGNYFRYWCNVPGGGPS